MCAFDVGRICFKTSGREANKKCIIVDIIDKSFVLVTGPKSLNGIKRRRVNLKHLKATEDVINIKQGATDEEVIKTLKEIGKAERMKAKTKS